LATVYNQILDNDEENTSSESQQAKPAVPTTQSSSTLGSSQGTSAASSQKASGAAPSSSGQFTNIQNYLQANKQGAKQLGQGVAQKVGAKVASGIEDIGKAKQTSVQNVQTIGQQGQQAQQQGQQAVQAIRTGGAQDLTLAEQQAKQGLSNEFGQNIQKSQFENLQNLTNKKQELNELGAQTRTGTGQQAILQRTYAKPDYTSGQSRFDSLLLGSSKEGQEGLSKARQQVGQFDPTLQRSVGEFEQQRTQQSEQINQGMQQLQQRIAEATARGQDATADKSLYAELSKQAADFNARQKAETAKISQADTIAALNNSGYKVKSLKDVVTIPGTNIKVSVGDIAKNPAFFQEKFQEANLGNINSEALNRLNVLNRLGNLDELQSTGNLNTAIQRSLSSAGSGALANAQAALKSQGLTNLNEFNVAKKSVTPEKMNQLAEGGLGFAGVRGEGVDMITNLQNLPNDQLADFLTKSGFGTNAKNAPKLIKDIIQDANAYMWAQQPENRFAYEDDNKNGRSSGSNPYNFTTNNPYYRPGQTWASYVNASEFAKKVAQEQLKYNQQQSAIQKILDKSIRGKK
jgi:hypothetical protein